VIIVCCRKQAFIQTFLSPRLKETNVSSKTRKINLESMVITSEEYAKEIAEVKIAEIILFYEV
jgi:hypothetical protein